MKNNNMAIIKLKMFNLHNNYFIHFNKTKKNVPIIFFFILFRTIRMASCILDFLVLRIKSKNLQILSTK